ncbi:MAG: pyridoxamine 5'-phosphate oxidase family protein [Agathobacter sp.]
MEFKSAIVFGRAEIVTDDTEKRKALRAICQRFLPSTWMPSSLRSSEACRARLLFA